MYVCVKTQENMPPVTKVALTKEESIKISDEFIADVTYNEGAPSPQSLPTPRGETKKGFWESGAFVIAHRHNVCI
jgi:hypothetical protein